MRLVRTCNIHQTDSTSSRGRTVMILWPWDIVRPFPLLRRIGLWKSSHRGARSIARRALGCTRPEGRDSDTFSAGRPAAR